MKRQRVLIPVGLASILAVLGCDDAVQPADRSLGSMEVTAFTSGPDLDVDGYSILIDGQLAADIDVNGKRVIENVPAGSRMVTFDDVATNCRTDADSRVVTVTANRRAATQFVITCVARTPPPSPAFGTLRITTATTGPEQDENGYTALISNMSGLPNHLFLPTNGTTSINLVAGSRYFVALSGIAANCRIETSKSPEQVAEIAANATTSVAFAIACQPTYPARLPAGTQLAFVRNGGIHLVNSDGTGVVRLTDGPRDCDPAWSPDGQRLAFLRGCNTAGASLHIMNADGSNPTRRTDVQAFGGPSWSPDGQRIAFAALNEGHVGIFTVSAAYDGVAPALLVSRRGWNNDPSWSPDGSKIAFVSDWDAFDFVYDIYVTPAASGAISQLTQGFAMWPNLVQFYNPAWSPDGSKLAITRCPAAYYTCDVSDVAILRADGNSVSPVAATRGFANPTWSPDGTLIAFSSMGTIGWVRPLTGERGFIVDQGTDPAWRPATQLAARRR